MALSAKAIWTAHVGKPVTALGSVVNNDLNIILLTLTRSEIHPETNDPNTNTHVTIPRLGLRSMTL